MKKIFHYLIAIMVLLLSSCSSRQYGLNKPSLLLQYYEGPYRWAGIVLGQSTLEDTIVILESLDFVDVESIYQADGYSGIDYRLFLDFQEGYREDGLCIWFVDDMAQVLVFPNYTLAEIQESLGEVEKFVAYGWMYERPMMDYFGYSTSVGYVIRGGPGNGKNLDELERVILSDDSIFSIKLIHPNIMMYVLGVEMGTAVRDYIISEGYFTDWHGYGEYEVIRPEYDLYMP